MRGYSDRTSEIAIGSVNKEWKQMANLAVIIREGRCNPCWAEEQTLKFKGIYNRLLTDPIEYVRKEAGR